LIEKNRASLETMAYPTAQKTITLTHRSHRCRISVAAEFFERDIPVA
jgi:hypothetical protein